MTEIQAAVTLMGGASGGGGGFVLFLDLSAGSVCASFGQIH